MSEHNLILTTSLLAMDIIVSYREFVFAWRTNAGLKYLQNEKAIVKMELSKIVWRYSTISS